MFHKYFKELGGIKEEVGTMKIQIKDGIKPLKKRPYRLNPNLKVKVKTEIDKILNVGIIKPIDELEWISPMVIQNKKIREIIIYLDYRELNKSCVYDPFPTPFTKRF